jgi:hypothetical protein
MHPERAKLVPPLEIFAHLSKGKYLGLVTVFPQKSHFGGLSDRKQVILELLTKSSPDLNHALCSAYCCQWLSHKKDEFGLCHEEK